MVRIDQCFFKWVSIFLLLFSGSVIAQVAVSAAAENPVHFANTDDFSAGILTIQFNMPAGKTSAEVEVKYAGYIEKERNQADKLHRLENVRIPEHFDYDKVASLSFEGREKLKKIRPATLSQASRISGVSPADVSILLIYMGR